MNSYAILGRVRKLLVRKCEQEDDADGQSLVVMLFSTTIAVLALLCSAELDIIPDFIEFKLTVTAKLFLSVFTIVVGTFSWLSFNEISKRLCADNRAPQLLLCLASHFTSCS